MLRRLRISQTICRRLDSLIHTQNYKCVQRIFSSDSNETETETEKEFKVSAQTFYDQTIARNSELLDPFMDGITKHIKMHANNNPFKILDIACGPGITTLEISKHLKSKYNQDIIGLDITQEMLDIARHNTDKYYENISNMPVSYVKGNVNNMPFNDNTFDMITARQCFHHFNEIPIIFKELKRVIKNNKESYIKYKFLVKDNEEDEPEIVIRETMKKYPNAFKFNKKWKYIFLYGREVDDLYLLNKEKIYTLHHPAIQELYQKTKYLETKLRDEEEKTNYFKMKILLLLETFANLNKKIESLEKKYKGRKKTTKS